MTLFFSFFLFLFFFSFYNVLLSIKPLFISVSYVKALDIWMGSCTAFVFLALVEFTVVNHIARHHRRYLFWGSVYWRSRLSSNTQNQAFLQPKQEGPDGASKAKCSNVDSLYTCAQTSSFGGNDDAGKRTCKKLSTLSTIVSLWDFEEIKYSCSYKGSKKNVFRLSILDAVKDGAAIPIDICD